MCQVYQRITTLSPYVTLYITLPVGCCQTITSSRENSLHCFCLQRTFDVEKHETVNPSRYSNSKETEKVLQLWGSH